MDAVVAALVSPKDSLNEFGSLNAKMVGNVSQNGVERP
jgi:hypothetical protein